ncbi:hypothetical protein ACJRPK_07540 [Aquimarina sp. 2-A2]|uniref:hypothetical protein n=1 Tax=Aquimarina sp. 2-A2 TaxID=3382644 RepID=UPI00387F17A7
MKLISLVILCIISSLSYAQETINYSIEWEIETPSLSILNSAIESSIFELLEVNLDEDLRRQELQKGRSILLVEKRPAPVRKYNFSIATKPKPSALKVTGSGATLNDVNSGNIKNSAYQDMSRYNRIYYARPNVFYYRQ